MWCKFGSPPNKLQGAHNKAEGVWGVCLKCCIIIESFLYSLKELQLRLPTTHIRPSPELVGQMKHGCVLWLTDSNLIGEWWDCKAGSFHSLVAINLSKINMNMGALSGWAFADIWDTLKRLKERTSMFQLTLLTSWKGKGASLPTCIRIGLLNLQRKNCQSSGSQTLQDSLLDFLGSAPDPPEERSAGGLSLCGYSKVTKLAKFGHQRRYFLLCWLYLYVFVRICVVLYREMWDPRMSERCPRLSIRLQNQDVPGQLFYSFGGRRPRNIHNMVRTVRKKHENVKIAVFRRKQVVTRLPLACLHPDWSICDMHCSMTCWSCGSLILHHELLEHDVSVILFSHYQAVSRKLCATYVWSTSSNECTYLFDVACRVLVLVGGLRHAMQNWWSWVLGLLICVDLLILSCCPF